MTKVEAEIQKHGLQGADLRAADLRHACLQGACLQDACLRDADLRHACLIGARLQGADLRDACLRDADLRHACLIGADLRGADLRGADLQGADLRGANLDRALLWRAELCDAKNFPAREIAKRQIVPAGELIVYKKLSYGFGIATLRIPASALRVGGLVGRKCRASQAIVVDGWGLSGYDSLYTYFVGKVCEPIAPFDSNPLIECASGIHFFLTREEAEDYDVA